MIIDFNNQTHRSLALFIPVALVITSIVMLIVIKFIYHDATLDDKYVSLVFNSQILFSIITIIVAVIMIRFDAKEYKQMLDEKFKNYNENSFIENSLKNEK